MVENKPLKVFSILFSALMSLALAVFSFYLGILKIYWFFAFGGFFLIDALITLIGSNKKDRYSGMTILGRWQAISVVLVMVYLLIMILWDDRDGLIPFTYMYITIGIAMGIKLIFAILCHVSISRRYQPILHAHRNYNIIDLVFLATLLCLVIVNQYYPGTGDGLLKEKPLWVYIIDISVNGTLTIFAALLALSTIVRAKMREEISTAGKVKFLLKWMSDNEISMFLSLIFTFYLVGLALMNVKTSLFYIFLAIYYSFIIGVRLINYLWHRTILKNSKNKINENRKSSWILLFNAAAYTLFSDIIAVGAIMLMIGKANAGTNIYLFLFITVPFAILKYVLAFRAIKQNKEKNNTYRLGLGYIALIGAMFSSLETVAIALHGVHNILKYLGIITAIVVVKVFVLVIAVIFVVHFFRSLIINRRSKEKRA